ncbi:ATP-grasp domain-containing protein [Rhodococcus rhodnii]|nr:biotin carboxylase N-terminal domain-containing protein [Rhodococcus rhodnii]TXG92550.1 ATP-grasp domain-containing protein [Rhodococcus rhodnii]
MTENSPRTFGDRPFESVLVANRGEIAVRIISTLRRKGIRSIAVYSDADADARHVREADEAVRLGPVPARQSYLDVDAVLGAARRTGASAIHPGYGFLSENAAFAAACADAGIVFVGPPAAAIEVMGDKITAKSTVSAFGVPVVPGIARPGLGDDDLIAAAEEIGYPVLVKPSAGGGGKGMRVVTGAEDLRPALISARREAASAFGDDTLFLERFVQRPRHIEVQILADAHGAVVHLGERECSLQRRHQKVIEEAPSPLLDAATRERIGAAACDTARSVDYRGAGTVEFIVSDDRPGEFFFMEMNTRLQVEHPVTEMVTGIDLVEQQLHIAAGRPLAIAQSDVVMRGHAIEARVYAEDPTRGFLPTGGTILDESLASDPERGVRVDSGVAAGTVVTSDYDPMLAKVVAHADDRDAALDGLDAALGRTTVAGVVTNIDFLRYLLAAPRVRSGELDTSLLDAIAGEYRREEPPATGVLAAAVAAWCEGFDAARDGGPWDRRDGWRIGAPAATTYRLAVTGSGGERAVRVALTGNPSSATARIGPDDDPAEATSHTLSATSAPRGPGVHVSLVVDDHRTEWGVVADVDRIWLTGARATWVLRPLARERALREETHSGDAELVGPMPGTVVSVPALAGAPVRAGDVVLVVEAMKMEHPITAPVDGTAEILVAAGDRVQVDQVLARILPPAPEASGTEPDNATTTPEGIAS